MSRLGGIWTALSACLLGLPFLALLLTGKPGPLSPGDLAAIWTSLSLSALALGAVACIGVPAAYWMARAQGIWIRAAELITLFALVTPPLAMGLLLILLTGPGSPAGRVLSQTLGWSLDNTPAAFVIAQFYAALPYFLIAARAAFRSVDPQLAAAARCLGSSPLRAALRVEFPVAAGGLAAAAVIGWVRAVGEFGIALLIAYFPQGIPVRLWVNLQDQGLGAVFPLLWALLALSLPALALLRFGRAAAAPA